MLPEARRLPPVAGLFYFPNHLYIVTLVTPHFFASAFTSAPCGVSGVDAVAFLCVTFRAVLAAILVGLLVVAGSVFVDRSFLDSSCPLLYTPMI
jgi:membrane protein implicated in regulation of membrane protease activity